MTAVEKKIKAALETAEKLAVESSSSEEDKIKIKNTFCILQNATTSHFAHSKNINVPYYI